MSEQNKPNDYDSEPVVYCANCLSLKIRYNETLDMDYCDCGCTDIRQCLPEEWERLYEKKYGRKYIEKADLRKSPIFQLPLNKLMRKVSDSTKWEYIIKEMYGHLPKGMSKADSIIVFFDKVIKENKLDALRTLLYRMKL